MGQLDPLLNQQVAPVWQGWSSLIGGAACFCAYSAGPFHPKGGSGGMIAIGLFAVFSALGIGLALAGMRFGRTSAKDAAWIGLALCGIVAIDLARILMSV